MSRSTVITWEGLAAEIRSRSTQPNAFRRPIPVDAESMFDAVRNAIVTTTSIPPTKYRSAEVVRYRNYTNVLRFFRIVNSDQAYFVFMDQGTRAVGNIVPKAEGSAAGEMSDAYSSISIKHVNIPVTLPVSSEILEDESRMQSILNSDMIRAIQQVLINQAINGSGSGNNMKGIVNWTGIPNVAITSQNLNKISPKVGEASKAIWDDVNSFPNAVLMDGSFITSYFQLYGEDSANINRISSPVLALRTGPEGNRRFLWGMDSEFVNISDGTNKTAIIGDFSYAVLSYRRMATVSMTNAYDEDFAKVLYRIRANIRAALIVLEPKAFRKLQKA